MWYVVYVNHPTSTATVHSASCWFYENRIADQTDHGYWTELLLTRDDAVAYARATGKRNVRTCSVCIG